MDGCHFPDDMHENLWISFKISLKYHYRNILFHISEEGALCNPVDICAVRKYAENASHDYPTGPLNMMTSWNGNIFCVTGHLCGELTGPSEFPAQKPVTQSFVVFFDLRLNKRLSKQSWGWWFETPSRPIWSHRNEIVRKQVTLFGEP